ncbi:hypothetical protein [Pseudoalteromonas sp. MMG012]|uniref:hypothetical protein n=1 Tax=Pseudoalteromonas sp. MMG012 TaxID=2822686 RepID=UPI001B3A77E5|nr:hypothetical protein [Pseudoalteromonas sp. MMG012]MBQ4851811.1 hypothetical protein [Pseudoalteromonas sp. MMG012]
MKHVQLVLITVLVLIFGYFMVLIVPNSPVESSPPVTPNEQPLIHRSAVKQQVPSMKAATESIPTKQLSLEIQNTLVPSNTEQRVKPYVPPIQALPSGAGYTGDLNDHHAYQQFHNDQEKALKLAYIIATKSKVKRLEALIERGKHEGVTEQQLAFAREKIAGLNAMANKLKVELNLPSQ